MTDLTNMTYDQLIDRAIRANQRYSKRCHCEPERPDRAFCTVLGNVICLANFYGVFAMYRVARTRLVHIPMSTEVEAASECFSGAARMLVSDRFLRLVGALADAGFAVAKTEYEAVWLVPGTSMRRDEVIFDFDPRGATDAIEDSRGLFDGYVEFGEGSVQSVVAHFTRIWAFRQQAGNTDGGSAGEGQA